MYLYRVNFNSNSIYVEVGIFDANRWAKSVERGEATHPGGMSFGETAEVYTRQIWNESMKTGRGRNRENPLHVAEVSTGSIGAHDTKTALRRADVYLQAVQIADFINDQLQDHETGLEQIGSFLSNALRQDPTNPADTPFRYDGSPAAADAASELS